MSTTLGGEPALVASSRTYDAPQSFKAQSSLSLEMPLCALSAKQLDGILDGSTSFTFHFQPIVELRQGITVGFEALARFSIGSERIAPNLVFDAATLHGRRCDLEDLVLREAIRSKQFLPANCFLTVNVGPGFFLTHRFDDLLNEFSSLGGIVVEITEDEAITDYPAIKQKLSLIRAKAGFAAVDDACSGYASLQHIMEIRPNFIKLDRAFVRGCCNDPAKAVLIEMLGKAANRLDAWLIAEGVETEAELDELIRLDVPLAQGFYLARPHPLMNVLDAAKSRNILSRIRALSSSGGLHRSVEGAVICSSSAEAEKRLLENLDGTIAVTLNPSGQPDMVLESHPHLGIRILAHPMKVQIASDPGEVLQRALTRPQALRFDPLIVVNEFGQLQGIIHLDRLMRETLAEP